MLLERSQLAAQSAERPRIAPPWMLAVLGLFVGSVLILIFPHTDLLARVQNAPADTLTLRYMSNLLRTDPSNHQIRLLLATHELRRGHTADARQTLAPLADATEPSLRNESAWLTWQSLDADLLRMRADDPARVGLADELRRRFRLLDISALPEDRIARIIDVAFLLGENHFAHELMRRAARQGSLSAEWFAGRARAALARGDYPLAADLYLLARTRGETIPERRRWFILALRALQAGNRLNAALTLADLEIGELFEDRETLIFLANLARAAANPEAAERYVRRLLRLALLETWRLAGLSQLRPVAFEPTSARPESAEGAEQGGPGLAFDQTAYRLGYLIFIENGKLEEAYRVAASAVRQRPKSLTWHERLAQVSEWTQRPTVALEEWQWIARSTDRADAWAHVRRLATLLNDSATQTELLRRDAAGGGISATMQLARSLETEGKPGDALAVIDRLLAAPRSAAERLELRRQRLALLDRMGSPDAIEESARLIAEPWATPAERRAHAERLAALDRREEALALLEAIEAQDPQAFDQANIDFWRFYGELASQFDRSDLANRAFRHVPGAPLIETSEDLDPADPTALALRETNPGRAFDLARENWLAKRQPDDLLYALDLALTAGRSAEGLALLDTLQPGEWRRLAAHPLHPQLAVSAARLLLKAKRRSAAIAVLKDALEHTPEDAVLGETLLWLAIEIASENPNRVDAEPLSSDRAERELLIRLLVAYEPRWAKQPALHDALAVAWLVLEQPERALHRYLRPQLAKRYGEASWRKTYDETLDTLERAEDRQRIGPISRLAGLRLARRERGPLDESESGIHLRTALPGSVYLMTDLADRRFGVNHRAQLGRVPASERELELTLGLDAETAGRQTRLTLIQHQGDRNSTGFRLGHRRTLDGHLRLEAALARDERSVESLALLLAGRQHRAQIDLAFEASSRDTLILTHRRDSYRIESGPELGASERWQFEATHRLLRGGAFDLSAAAFLSSVQTTRRTITLTDPAIVQLQGGDPSLIGAPDAGFFVPLGFSLRGLRLSSGLEYRDVFTRTPRPYLNLSRSWHSLYGPADEAEIGIAASVFGHDHLRFGLTQGRNVSGGTETFREILLSYRLHF